MNDSALAVPQRGLVDSDGVPIRAGAPSFDEEQYVKDMIFTKLGPLDDLELFFNDVLVAKYIREKVSENLVASHETQKADTWEGVIGLVLKMGPRAFQDDEHTKFYGIKAQLGDWVLYRASDGWDKHVQIVGEYGIIKCRVIQDAHIRGRVRYPGRWF